MLDKSSVISKGRGTKRSVGQAVVISQLPSLGGDSLAFALNDYGTIVGKRGTQAATFTQLRGKTATFKCFLATQPIPLLA